MIFKSQVDPVVGALRIVDATGRKSRAFQLSAAPYAAALDAPSYVARSRSGERLFLLLDLTRTAPAHRYRELRELFVQAYWSESASITAGLRRAVATVNRRMFFENLGVDPTERCIGGLACAVLKDDDVFILLAGDVQACFFRDGRLLRFSSDDLTPLLSLGMSRSANVHLGHVFVAPGDKLLLTSSSLLRAAGEGGIARVMPGEGIADVMEGLEQVGAGADFVALLMDCATPEKASAAREVLQSLSRLKETVRTRTEPAPETFEPPEPVERPSTAIKAPETDVEQSPEPEVAPPPLDRHPPIPTTPGPARPVGEIPVHVASAVGDAPLPAPEEMPEIVREPTPGLADRVAGRVKGGLGLGLGLGKRAVGHALSGVSNTFSRAGSALVGGLRALPRRILPGPERRVRRHSKRASRPAPQEDPTTMIALAVGIPILLAVIVMWAYQAFGEKSQFESLIDQANQALEQATSAGGVTEAARPHWEEALAQADAALALRPDGQVAVDLRTKAQSALDQLDGIKRLSAQQLWDFGDGDTARRLVAHGQMIFVLDPAAEWVARLTLNANGDGLIEQEDDDPFIIRQGQEIGEHSVGDLIDLVWVELMGGRQTSGLLVLEEDGAVVVYDPAWEGEGGEIQLSHFALGTPPEAPMMVDTYDGRLYVLDAAANQIRRYKPQGDRYPGRPENYFVDPPPRSIHEALDVAIDGYIYLLYPGGEIHKFLSGKPDTFVVQDIPGELEQASALSVDPNGSSGAIYVVDRARVVVLGSDGAFHVQFRADGVFEQIEALTVDESSARLYVISDGQLYVASIP